MRATQKAEDASAPDLVEPKVGGIAAAAARALKVPPNGGLPREWVKLQEFCKLSKGHDIS
jgi:hypothetical protein